MLTRIATVYTGATPLMITLMEESLHSALPGVDFHLLIYTDPGIIGQVIADGEVTPDPASRLVSLYTAAMNAKANVIINICSSMGDVASAAAPLYKIAGTPIVRVDEGMARAAVEGYSRIGVLATLPTTIDPTKRIIQRCAGEIKKKIALVDALALDAYGLPPDKLTNKLIDAAEKIAGDIDVLVMAQASMALCEEKVSKAIGKPVLSSPRLCGGLVRNALGVN